MIRNTMNARSKRPSPLSTAGRRPVVCVAAFTLLELLIVIALIALLASLLLPAIGRAKEKAKVTRVHGELYGVGLALEMYAQDHDGRVPPVRVNCNSDLAMHYCQFPVELAEQGYLPKGNQPGMAAYMEDPFNPGHTYKYAAPGPCLMNDTPDVDYRVWIPDDFPECHSATGKYHSSPANSPLKWVIWSLGPQPDSAKSRDSRAPMAARTWYRKPGEGGVIARMATRDGTQYKTP